ncbi:hypothetical protein BDY17DRAFT_38502 [Neohortaea acidophila]|uniref:Uncharacterized protein n=1 Tax=Neohortaea acidophila TaxID=245834 RepID=A0A6A6PI98_9PEZI|nr:uncharacterized protein BDY17DRAFT_38502 [Neohortaea acidophila]KAF2479434.1 hypothetical protein BDY17DRAFT_38502 [Neohortaea acidophila]
MQGQTALFTPSERLIRANQQLPVSDMQRQRNGGRYRRESIQSWVTDGSDEAFEAAFTSSRRSQEIAGCSVAGSRALVRGCCAFPTPIPWQGGRQFDENGRSCYRVYPHRQPGSSGPIAFRLSRRRDKWINGNVTDGKRIHLVFQTRRSIHWHRGVSGGGPRRLPGFRRRDLAQGSGAQRLEVLHRDAPDGDDAPSG